MALKINLKGGDSLLVATSRFTVAGEGYTTIIIEGDIPVMRESEAIARDEVTTGPERFLFYLQQHYLSADPAQLDLAKTSTGDLSAADNAIAQDILKLLDAGKSFKALRMARALAGL